MPLLALPLALIGLVALPALAAIYVLRTRYRRRAVSSLMLWQAAAQATGGGRKASRMQTPWVLLLELLALLLLVLAATMPRWLATGQRARVMVVLDNSWSMRAVGGDGRSAVERGAEAVRDELAGLGRYTAGFVLAGREPQRLAASARDAAGVREALTGWTAEATAADLASAVALARETGGADVRVVVVTDRTAPETGSASPENAEAVDPADAVRWRAVGEPGDNAAVVRAVRGGGGAARDVVMVEVGRFGTAAGPARTVGVQIDALVSGVAEGPDAAWNVVARKRLALEPGETTRVWFDPDGAPAATAVRTAGRLLRVSVALPGDVLAADDRAWLAAPDAQPVRVAVGVEDAALRDAVDAALAATGQTAPARVADDAELWVTQATFPAATDADGGGREGTPGRWSLRLFGPAEADDTQAFLGPFLLDTDHPVTKDLGLEGVVWSAVADADRLDAWARRADAVLASAGDVPLITWRGGDASRTAEIGLNLDAARSTLTGGVAWPVFMSNVVQARAAARPGTQPVNVPAGAPVALRAGERYAATDPDGPDGGGDVPAAPARVRWVAGLGGVAAGEPTVLALRDGAATWTLPRPGVYEVALPGLEPQTVVAAGTDAAESDLSGATTGATGDLNADVLSRPEYRGLGWLLGLGALSLLSAEAWLLRGGAAAAGSAPTGGGG